MGNATRADSRCLVRMVGLAVIALTSLAADGPFSRLTVGKPAAQTATPPLRARVPFEKPAQTRLRTSDDPRVIVVKFREGTRIRQQGLAWVSPSALRLSPQELGLRDRFGLDDGVIESQVATANRLVAGQRVAVLQRLFDRPEDVLEREQRRGEAQSGKELPDLNLYYVLLLKDADASRTELLLDELNALEIVEIAYPESDAKPAGGVDISPPTPDFTAAQGYLGPWGVSANYARTTHNVRGQGVKIIDVERNWRFDHEDLPNVFRAWGTPWGSSDWTNHGTAVLGILAAQDNGYGMIGIAPDAVVGVASDLYSSGNLTFVSVPWAINQAAAQLGPGDVILIEMGPRGPDSGQTCPCDGPCDDFEYVPMEWNPASFDAILSATSNRVIVVEAAHNGSMNLDSPIYQGRFDRSVRDSGAIIVGGSTGSTRVPSCSTNYGSRVDLHAWGRGVATLGDGDLAKVNGSDARQFYTDTFSGTSAASAIVAGVVAAAQSYVTTRGVRLFPSEMASLLSKTGVAQAPSDKQIGPLPNLYGVISAYEAGDFCQDILVSTTAGTRSSYVPPFGHLDYCFTVSLLDAIRAVPYVFDTCSGTNFDTKLVVSGPQGVIGSNNDGCGGNSRQSKVAIRPTVEGSYRVRVSGSLGAGGDMTLRYVKIPPPIQTSAATVPASNGDR